jgi:hypothetical protein
MRSGARSDFRLPRRGGAACVCELGDGMATAEATTAGLPSYATFLNLKKVVPSATTGYFAVESHLFYELMSLFLAHVRVDEKWYLEKHPDIKEAIAKRVVTGARDHFLRFGFYEHRMPYQIDVDESWYLANYPDVAEAVRKELFFSGQVHFETVGYREGRLPHANFALRRRNDANSTTFAGG